MPKKHKLNPLFLGFFLILTVAVSLANLLLIDYHARIQTYLSQQRVLGLQTSQHEEEINFWEKISTQFPTYKPAREKLQKFH